MTASHKQPITFTEALFAHIEGERAKPFTFGPYTTEAPPPGWSGPEESVSPFFTMQLSDVIQEIGKGSISVSDVDKEVITVLEQYATPSTKSGFGALSMILNLAPFGTPAIAPALLKALQAPAFQKVDPTLQNMLFPLVNSCIGGWLVTPPRQEFTAEQNAATLEIIDHHLNASLDDRDALVYFVGLAARFPDDFLNYAPKLKPALPTMDSLRASQAEWNLVTTYIQRLVSPQNAARYAAALPEYREFFAPTSTFDAEPPPP